MDTRHLMTSRHSLLNWLLCGSRPCKDPLSLSGRLGYRLEARNDHGMILRGRVLGDQHHLNGPTVASRHVWQHETRDADECDKRQVGTCEKMKFSSVKKDVCGCVSFFKISLSLSLLGWRPLLLGWRPSLVGWRPLLLGWRPSLLGSLSLSLPPPIVEISRFGRPKGANVLMLRDDWWDEDDD